MVKAAETPSGGSRASARAPTRTAPAPATPARVQLARTRRRAARVQRAAHVAALRGDVCVLADTSSCAALDDS